MDLLSPLILMCSLVSDTQLVSALATVASERQVYYVRNKGEWKGTSYLSKKQVKVAIGRASTQVFVGPLGVPLAITKEGRYSIDQVLDSCRNVAIGTEYLKVFLEDCETSGEANPRRCGVKLYAQWIGQQPDLFYQQVIKADFRKKSPTDKALAGRSSGAWTPHEPKSIELPNPFDIPQPTLPKSPTPPSFRKTQ
ncbi:MAG: hypothetical protein ACPGYT_02475 [Nitrospirales bacterium]